MRNKIAKQSKLVSKFSIASLAFGLTFSASSAFAEETKKTAAHTHTRSGEVKNIATLPTIVVKGTADNEYEVPLDFAGSASYVDQKEIEKKQTGDVNRIIREIPGINIQEEDGYGLRPNIGMRGSRNDRSSDITIMEDGVLTSPAAYSAPAAYYFPSMGRVKGVEVRKGSSSIKYGPRTTSGAINLITTPIPETAKGEITTSVGQFDEKRFNANFGNSQKNYGYVVNFDHSSSDGFKDLDGGGDTGYALNDFMGKFRVNTDKDADIYQHLEFKVGLNDEVSNETYLGLTAEDFKQNPYRRYKASALDEMNAEHRQYQATHYIEPSDNFNVTTTIYRNEFDRSWYKLQDVNDGSGNVSLSDVFTNNNTAALDILKGYANGSFRVRDNNRSYVAQGIQSVAQTKVELGKAKHNFEYGLRYHYDEEDRFQHQDVYAMNNGQISLTTAGAPGSQTNQLVSSKAFAAFVEDKIEIGKWAIVPGVRFENIKSESKNRTTNVKNESSELAVVPGLATSYLMNDNLALFAGVHKGFTPPPVTNRNASPEESINYEAGLRFRDQNKFFETTFFFNDYDNLLGTDTNSGGGGGTGDQYNGGSVNAYGIEVAAGYNFKVSQVNFPLALTYTFNEAEFRNSFTENGISEWGDVQKGDKLPYVPRHQIGLTAGVEVQQFSFYLSGKYVDEMRATAGKGTIAKEDKIPSHFVADASSFYEFEKDRKVFVAVDNIFDREYVASLRPAGMRPGKPMTARVGVILGF